MWKSVVRTSSIRLTHGNTELSTATGEFAQTVGDLSSSDVGKQLSQSLSGLADVERKAQDLQTTQSEQDMVTLMGTGADMFPSI